MSVKLSSGCSQKIIQAKEMYDGQIGVIVDWKTSPELYVGRVVQAFGGSLVTIGANSGESWSYRHLIGEHGLVRLLEVGETIEVTSN